jgi:tetratricopeptide (TPR) repeat protein
LVIEITGRKKTAPRFTLDDLVGLEPIKRELRKIEAMLWLNRHRRSGNLGELTLQSFHFSFRGNPGTGKTTVARLIGEIFHRYGLLRVGDVVEVDRAKLIGPTPGETETRTRKALKSALDGVLFIDEAYSLLGSRDSSDPGIRALEVILKGMEDYRDALIVVFAGYPAEMDSLFDHVTGLRSRVPYHLDFPDYSPRELVDIAIFMAASEKLELSDEASAAFLTKMEERSRLSGFSNAREVRNLIDQAKARLSARLQSRRKVTQWDMKVITAADLQDDGSGGAAVLEEAKREMYRSPSDPDARCEYARACSDAGLWSDVVSILDPVRESIPAEDLSLFGRALYIVGERKRSWEVFSCLETAGSFFRGLSALWSGDLREASKHLQESAAREPDDPDIHLALAAGCFFGGDFSGSARSFSKGLDLCGSRLPSLLLRDLPYQELQWKESAQNLAKALHYAYGSPDRSRLYFTRALIDTGEKSALCSASELVFECIDRTPDDPSAHRMMSLIQESEGNLREATASLEISLELEPRRTEDWRRLALLFEKTGQKERAEEIFTDILEEDPTGGAGLRLAAAAEARGDLQGANELYRKAWATGLGGEERLVCALKLGVYSATSGRFAEGARFLREAGDLAKEPEAAFWMARALIEEGKWQDAETLLLGAPSEGPIETARLYWLCRIYIARRDLFSAKNIQWENESGAYTRLARGVTAALSGDPSQTSLLEGLPARDMGCDALFMLCSARASLKHWDEARSLGNMAQSLEYGPFLWERQIKRPREEAAYLAAVAEAHLGNWAGAREGFRRSASALRHPGPVFAFGVSMVATGNIDEARRIASQIQMSSPSLSHKLDELIIQNSGIRKMMADPVDPGILDLYAFI